MSRFPLWKWSNRVSLSPLLVFLCLQCIRDASAREAFAVIAVFALGWNSARLAIYIHFCLVGIRGFAEMYARWDGLHYRAPPNNGAYTTTGAEIAALAAQRRLTDPKPMGLPANFQYFRVNDLIYIEPELSSQFLIAGGVNELAFGRISELYGGFRESSDHHVSSWGGVTVYYVRPLKGPILGQYKAFCALGVGTRIFIIDWPPDVVRSSVKDDAVASWKLIHEMGHVTTEGIKATAAPWILGLQSVWCCVGLAILSRTGLGVAAGLIALAVAACSKWLSKIRSEFIADYFAVRYLPASKLNISVEVLINKEWAPYLALPLLNAERIVTQLRIQQLLGKRLGSFVGLLLRFEQEVAAVLVGTAWFLILGDASLAYGTVFYVWVVTCIIALFIASRGLALKVILPLARKNGNFDMMGRSGLCPKRRNDDAVWTPFRSRGSA